MQTNFLSFVFLKSHHEYEGLGQVHRVEQAMHSIVLHWIVVKTIRILF